MILVAACVALASQLAAARPVLEQHANRMLRLLKGKPRAMTHETWLEQRREAARELGRLRDRRAVPLLLKIVARERFDVILEIGIDALGEIGDRRAVAPLRRLLNDPSLDSYVRDAVAGALKKIGAGQSDPRSRPTVRPRRGSRGKPRPATRKDDNWDPVDPGLAGSRPRRTGELHPVDKSAFGRVLSKTDRWRIGAGAVDAGWDGAAGQTRTRVELSSQYFRKVERDTLGYSIDGRVDLGVRFDDTSDEEASWDVSHGLSVTPEIRYYPFQRDLPALFGQLVGGVGYALGLADHPLFLERRFSASGHLTLGVGPGFGRVLNVGPRLRLKRLELLLREAGALTGPIPPEVGTRILHAWYQDRNRIGTARHMDRALAILRRSGLLSQGAVDPATTYRLVRILDDPQLDDRPAGMMFRAGYAYARAFVKHADDMGMGFLYLTGEYIRQRIRYSLEGRLRFFYEMLGSPDFYGLEFQGAYNAYFYSAASDPLGALGGTCSVGVSNQDGAGWDNGGAALKLLAGISYSRFFDRGSAVVAALRGGLQNGAPLVLFTLEARYGIATGTLITAK